MGPFILILKYRIVTNIFPIFSLASQKTVLPHCSPPDQTSPLLLTPQPPSVLLPFLHIAETFHHIVHRHQRTVLAKELPHFVKSNIWIFLDIRFNFPFLSDTEDTFSAASRQRVRLSVATFSHPATHSIHMISKNFQKLPSCRPALETRTDHQRTNFCTCFINVPFTDISILIDQGKKLSSSCVNGRNPGGDAESILSQKESFIALKIPSFEMSKNSIAIIECYINFKHRVPFRSS